MFCFISSSLTHTWRFGRVPHSHPKDIVGYFIQSERLNELRMYKNQSIIIVTLDCHLCLNSRLCSCMSIAIIILALMLIFYAARVPSKGLAFWRCDSEQHILRTRLHLFTRFATLAPQLPNTQLQLASCPWTIPPRHPRTLFLDALRIEWAFKDFGMWVLKNEL